jgi:hypothetical protein
MGEEYQPYQKVKKDSLKQKESGVFSFRRFQLHRDLGKTKNLISSASSKKGLM